MEGADGDHGHIAAGDLTGHDRLQAGDHIGAEDDRVDRVLRLGTVCLLAFDGHAQAVGHRHGGAAADVEVACGNGPHVLTEDDVGPHDLVPEPVVEHGPRTLAGLLTGLEDHDDSSRPQVSVCDEVFGEVEPDGDVGVVSAAVHDLRGRSVGKSALCGGGVVKAGVLGDRQSVDVGTVADDGPVAVLDHGDDSGSPEGVCLQAEGSETGGDLGGGVRLLHRQFGSAVEVFVVGNRLVEIGADRRAQSGVERHDVLSAVVWCHLGRN